MNTMNIGPTLCWERRPANDPDLAASGMRYGCSLPVGHEGDHEAWGGGLLCARWPR